jgi:hypothetical protein
MQVRRVVYHGDTAAALPSLSDSQTDCQSIMRSATTARAAPRRCGVPLRWVNLDDLQSRPVRARSPKSARLGSGDVPGVRTAERPDLCAYRHRETAALRDYLAPCGIVTSPRRVRQVCQVAWASPSSCARQPRPCAPQSQPGASGHGADGVAPVWHQFPRGAARPGNAVLPGDPTAHSLDARATRGQRGSPPCLQRRSP